MDGGAPRHPREQRQLSPRLSLFGGVGAEVPRRDRKLLERYRMVRVPAPPPISGAFPDGAESLCLLSQFPKRRDSACWWGCLSRREAPSGSL